MFLLLLGLEYGTGSSMLACPFGRQYFDSRSTYTIRGSVIILHTSLKVRTVRIFVKEGTSALLLLLPSSSFFFEILLLPSGRCLHWINLRTIIYSPY